uniref:Uncharacterized protein n=1 Tax=Arundo donax TaxID=35708 RepID=A0A0A8Y8K1_ARUDO
MFKSKLPTNGDNTQIRIINHAT